MPVVELERIPSSEGIMRQYKGILGRGALESSWATKGKNPLEAEGRTRRRGRKV